MITKNDTGLKHFCYKARPNLNFMVTVYKVRRTVGSDHFSKTVICYKQKGTKDIDVI